MNSDVSMAEKRSVAWATAWFFFILLGYLVIRPVRDALGSLIGTDGLQVLMWVTLGVMLLVVPAYSWLVAKLPRRWLVRSVYHCFTACLILFYGLMQIDSDAVQLWTSRLFFVWVNVFALFATSVFWSVLADLFNNQQGKRLFGIVAAGGTAGAVTGSLLTTQIVDHVSTAGLLLIPAATLQAGLACAWRLEKSQLKRVQPSKLLRSTKSTSGVWSGITAVLGSPYLASICLFLFFVQAMGTQLYFQQAEIVADVFETKEQRVQFFASLDLGTQLLTLVIQTVAAGWVLRRWGVAVALVALPLVYFVALGALAASPVLSVLVIAMIATRSVGYGMTVPAREVLFTVVSTDQKYKSKSFIDTVVLRGGDAISGALFSGLRQTGMAASSMNLAALPLIALWAIVAWRLGKRSADQANVAVASSRRS